MSCWFRCRLCWGREHVSKVVVFSRSIRMILSIMIFWIVISIRIKSMIEPVWMFTFVANKVVKHWVMIIMHRSHLRMVRVEL